MSTDMQSRCCRVAADDPFAVGQGSLGERRGILDLVVPIHPHRINRSKTGTAKGCSSRRGTRR